MRGKKEKRLRVHVQGGVLLQINMHITITDCNEDYVDDFLKRKIVGETWAAVRERECINTPSQSVTGVYNGSSIEN